MERGNIFANCYSKGYDQWIKHSTNNRNVEIKEGKPNTTVIILAGTSLKGRDLLLQHTCSNYSMAGCDSLFLTIVLLQISSLFSQRICANPS